ncbi:MAG: PH domain-containing protein [Bacteroides sp.]|nr:PH domain-containing protein [Bacteroides sp.]
MKYFFKPDAWVIVITILSVLAIAVMWHSINKEKWYFIVLVSLVTFLIGYFVAKIPLYVKVGVDEITVKQIVGKMSFNRQTVKITSVDKKELKNTVRTFGNGGIGGYVGWFASPGLGRFYMLAVNRKELAKVITETGKIYVINYPGELLQQG